MRVALVENTAITHHGQVGVALAEAGAIIDIFRPFANGRLPALGEHDALVVFGGEQSARDDARHPYLPALAALMAETAETGRAVLGLCLGAQLLARGLGADNRLGAAREFGWCPVERCADATGDAVMAAAPARFLATQWHSDTFDLPAGAVHLARSGIAEAQGFRHGRAGYGFQFHLEAHRAVVADWLRRFPDQVAAIDPGFAAEHPRRAETDGAAADAEGLGLARRWVALI
ncbi:MAG: type 1 glutamine amidotransferase [Rhodobacteraceae bacterium]|nr:type 1 glutamine amidotransferase [Paracoccaceae bacterium]